MKPPTAERSDAGPKMKFFTPELMIRFNSLDDDEADQDWDAALHAYRNHTADLRVRFRKPLEQLMHLSLHDAELLANLPLIELSSPFANGEELRCSVIDVRQGDQIISLTYFLGGEVQSDKTGSAPARDPVHPGELLATIYHAFGIDPATIVYNHLNQPRELVKAETITRLFAG